MALKFRIHLLLSIALIILVPPQPGFADKVEVNPQSVRLVRNKKFFSDEQLEVVAKGETLLTIKMEKNDIGSPSVEHIKNFFKLHIKEAEKMDVPVIIDKLTFPIWADNFEGRFGPKNPDYHGAYIQESLFVEPHRIKVHQDKKTNAVIIRIDGLEVLRREEGKAWGDKVNDYTLKSFYNRLQAVIESANSNRNLVGVQVGSSFWEDSRRVLLKNPLYVSDKPVLTESQILAQQMQILKRQREFLVAKLRIDDTLLQDLEKKGADRSDENFRRIFEEREQFLKQLKDLDAKLDVLEAKQSEDTQNTDDRRHSSGENSKFTGSNAHSSPSTNSTVE